MEETKKSSKGLIVLVIILIICILGLGGYIVYDKMLNKQTQTTNNTKSSTTKLINNESEHNIELKDLKFPTQNDESVIIYGDISEYLNSEDKQKIGDLVDNYQNIILTKQNIIFNFSCSDYNLEEKFCYEETININNKFNIIFSLDRGYSEQTFFLITNKYVIVQKSMSAISLGDIEIYDYDGNLLKKIENTTNYLVSRGKNGEYLYGGDISYNMRFVENKLHYIVDEAGAIYKTLNLETFEENTIDKIDAYTTQQH